MADFPVSNFSKRDVKRAGEMLAGDLIWTDDTAEGIREAFQIANSWRDAHAYPMRSIRQTVIHHLSHGSMRGITAARLKRMQAIRRKLRRVKLSLTQLQDLGGCRVLLDSIEDVHALVAMLRDTTKHDIRAEDNYIAKPKADGYRSHHLMFTFRGEKPYDGKRIELQLRTRLQHSWATAVEAVSLFRGADLKSKDGLGAEADAARRKDNEHWLRLFLLLSAEFAETEGCALPPLAPSREDRRREIKAMSKSLGALSLLDSIRHGMQGTDNIVAQDFEATHYLIRFDHLTQTTQVKPFRRAIAAAQDYDRAEEAGNKSGNGSETVVLVEVDKVDNLKAAYPNYFGDVEFFRNQLRAITLGHAAVEYASAPRQPPPRPLGLRGDLSWLRRTRFRSPDK